MIEFEACADCEHPRGLHTVAIKVAGAWFPPSGLNDSVKLTALSEGKLKAPCFGCIGRKPERFCRLVPIGDGHHESALADGGDQGTSDPIVAEGAV